MKAELKAHKHKQSRKGCNINDQRKELLDHYYFVHENFDESVANISIQKKVCYCQSFENAADETIFWIRCDDDNCEKEWFHLNCLELRSIAYPSTDNIESGNNFKK